MKHSFEARLRSLEENADPRMIATLADLVLWMASGRGREVILTPQMQDMVERWSMARDG
jgi:hypothetical protein